MKNLGPASASYLQWVREGSYDKRATLKVLAELWLKREPRNREGSFSCNDTGRCLRFRLLKFLGTSNLVPTDSLMAVYIQSNWTQLKHQIAGKVTGYLKDIEVPFHSEEYLLGGTADGITEDDEIFMFRSLSSAYFRNARSQGPIAGHLDQAHAYMLVSGLEQVKYLAECKDSSQLYEIVITPNVLRMEKIKKHLKVLNRAVEQGRMLGCSDSDGCVECRNG